MTSLLFSCTVHNHAITPIIAHVTPSEIQIWIADNDVALEIIKGKYRTLFDKPREDIEIVDFLGPHLMTVSRADTTILRC